MPIHSATVRSAGRASAPLAGAPVFDAKAYRSDLQALRGAVSRHEPAAQLNKKVQAFCFKYMLRERLMEIADGSQVRPEGSFDQALGIKLKGFRIYGGLSTGVDLSSFEPRLKALLPRVASGEMTRQQAWQKASGPAVVSLFKNKSAIEFSTRDSRGAPIGIWAAVGTEHSGSSNRRTGNIELVAPSTYKPDGYSDFRPGPQDMGSRLGLDQNYNVYSQGESGGGYPTLMRLLSWVGDVWPAGVSGKAFVEPARRDVGFDPKWW